MRIKKQTKLIVVTQEVYEQLIKDRNYLQKNNNVGKWSISDTISLYQKTKIK